jgi:hypothetical protein
MKNDALTAWVAAFPGSVTVCDPAGVILAMNDKGIRTYGEGLIGQNALDCHPGKSREEFADLLRNPRVNVYTTEKKGVHKIVYQCPWHHDGKYAGLLEIVAEIPAKMPHFIRQS